LRFDLGEAGRGLSVFGGSGGHDLSS
jgi:hypothetical protein